jgi:phosphonate transport system ATP-binding protein
VLNGERPLLGVRGLSLRYPNGTLALDDVDIDVRAGELLIVLGGNGCGKTTLLRCVTRALMPTQGEVWLNHAEISRLEGEKLRRARLDLAMISQHASLVRRRSVLANVATGSLGRHQTLWTSLGGLPADELRAAHDHLHEVGLRHLAAQRASTLSGGQAQRVAIARALAQRPLVVLADEPVASLDPEAAQEIMRLLRRLAHHDGLAVLCVLHQVDLAFAYADHVVGMRDGRVEFNQPRAGLSRDAVNRLYLAEAA